MLKGEGDMTVCSRCGEHEAMHYTGKWWDKDEDLCCWCHIKEGGIPADWHTVCMIEFNKRTTGNEVKEEL
jgi:uncharacterized protein CbrC (UPF0167 family)